MIKIRNSCFETNSSSTHCLVIQDEEHIDPIEDVFNKQYIVYPFTESVYEAKYTTIEDKLRYFLTIYYQGEEYHTSIMQMLAQMFPNALFIRDFRSSGSYGPHPYIFEDSEYYTEEFTPTYEQLKEFMLYGEVHFGSRDDDEFYHFTNKLTQNSKFYCKWSG